MKEIEVVSWNYHPPPPRWIVLPTFSRNFPSTKITTILQYSKEYILLYLNAHISLSCIIYDTKHVWHVCIKLWNHLHYQRMVQFRPTMALESTYYQILVCMTAIRGITHIHEINIMQIMYHALTNTEIYMKKIIWYFWRFCNNQSQFNAKIIN